MRRTPRTKRLLRFRGKGATREAGPQTAQQAGLRYVTDSQPGIRRIRCGVGFRYVTPDGRRITAKRELARIKALVIPPAWEDVWICPLENGHLQATGRDAKGRKQPRYHDRWREVRDETKYDRMLAFGQALPRLRRRIKQDLASRGLTRHKVLATVLQLMATTLIRVGNESYARENDSFGLTTLHGKHVDVSGSRIRFEFRGKSGVIHAIDVCNPRLARIVKRCQDLPGQQLFQFVDGTGRRHGIDSSDVNNYLKTATGKDFTSKDFRTWAGTALAAGLLHRMGPSESQAQAKRHIVQTIASVAEQLGNTKTVCRKCYIHPAVLDAYLDGSLKKAFQAARRKTPRLLKQEEAAVIALLRARSR